MSPALSFEKKEKATQQWGLRVANDFVLNHVNVYHDRVYAYIVVNNFWSVRCFFSQHQFKLNANKAIRKWSQVHTKESKKRFINYRVNLNLLRSSRHFNCDRVFAVIASFSKESVHSFKISNAKKTSHLCYWRIAHPHQVSQRLISSNPCAYSLCSLWRSRFENDSASSL